MCALKLLHGVPTQFVDVELMLTRLAQSRELLATIGAEYVATLTVDCPHVHLGPVCREDGLAQSALEAVVRVVHANKVRAAVIFPSLSPLVLRPEEAPVRESLLSPHALFPEKLLARRAHHKARRLPVEQDRLQKRIHLGYNLSFDDSQAVRLLNVDVGHFDQSLQISEKA